MRYERDVMNMLIDALGVCSDSLGLADATSVGDVGLYNVNDTALKVWSDILASEQTLSEL